MNFPYLRGRLPAVTETIFKSIADQIKKTHGSGARGRVAFYSKIRTIAVIHPPLVSIEGVPFPKVLVDAAVRRGDIKKVGANPKRENKVWEIYSQKGVLLTALPAASKAEAVKKAKGYGQVFGGGIRVVERGEKVSSVHLSVPSHHRSQGTTISGTSSACGIPWEPITTDGSKVTCPLCRQAFAISRSTNPANTHHMAYRAGAHAKRGAKAVGRAARGAADAAAQFWHGVRSNPNDFSFKLCSYCPGGKASTHEVIQRAGGQTFYACSACAQKARDRGYKTIKFKSRLNPLNVREATTIDRVIPNAFEAGFGDQYFKGFGAALSTLEGSRARTYEGIAIDTAQEARVRGPAGTPKKYKQNPAAHGFGMIPAVGSCKRCFGAGQVKLGRNLVRCPVCVRKNPVAPIDACVGCGKKRDLGGAYCKKCLKKANPLTFEESGRIASGADEDIFQGQAYGDGFQLSKAYRSGEILGAFSSTSFGKAAGREIKEKVIAIGRKKKAETLRQTRSTAGARRNPLLSHDPNTCRCFYHKKLRGEK